MSDDAKERSDELRRLARAAIAARAAAESCQQGLEGLDGRLERLDGRLEGLEGRLDGRDADDVLRALLSFRDALGRTARQATRIVTARPRWWPWFRSRDAEALAHAIALLQSQLDQLLEAEEVELEESVGVFVDGSLHRVVEMVPGPAERVLAIVRAGARRRGRVLREADVIAGQGTSGSAGGDHD